jgi:hypothetical protein
MMGKDHKGTVLVMSDSACLATKLTLLLKKETIWELKALKKKY